ncbi:MAG: helix-turn-helix domain-containing protein [Pseudomonadota bacterium]
MKTETYRLASYLAHGESFHYARKMLAKRFPARAHTHDFHEVFLITRGRTAHWINGQMQTLAEGQLVFIRPHDAHAFRAAREGCEIVNVMYESASAAHLVARYGDTLRGRFFDAPGALPELHTLGPQQFERALAIAGQLQTADRTLARIEEFLLTLCNRVAVPSAQGVAAGPAWFSAACSAAQDIEVFRLGAAGFIAAAGRSHEHVCRTCKEVLGLTPTDYVNRIRIDHAARLLRTEDASIEAIASRCGFENTSYFYRLFARSMGETPKRYRAAQKRDPFAAAD